MSLRIGSGEGGAWPPASVRSMTRRKVGPPEPSPSPSPSSDAASESEPSESSLSSPAGIVRDHHRNITGGVIVYPGEVSS